MKKPKKMSSPFPLKETIKDLESALVDFERVQGDQASQDLEQFRQKTRALLNQLSEQIKALEL
ncbi:MAG: hypothetical protein IT289_01170 [Oligoflexia bacterium]|nr:hypothetical protein [Oligoflexia bacterium]